METKKKKFQLRAAHPSEIFALAATADGVFSASGGSAIKMHRPPSSAPVDDGPTANAASASTTSVAAIEIPKAHSHGCHHLATGRGGPGKVLASAGFGQDAKIWIQSSADNSWTEHATVRPWGEANKSAAAAARVWAVALSADEQFLACSSEAGKVAVWDVVAGRAVHLYETAASGADGSFGMCVDLSPDGRFAASGHENGTVYVFNNDSGRLIYSLTGE